MYLILISGVDFSKKGHEAQKLFQSKTLCIMILRPIILQENFVKEQYLSILVIFAYLIVFSILKKLEKTNNAVKLPRSVRQPCNPDDLLGWRGARGKHH